MLLQCVSLHAQIFSNSDMETLLPVLMNNHKEVEAIIELSRAMDFKLDLQLLHF